jgi:hypothetical protein
MRKKLFLFLATLWAINCHSQQLEVGMAYAYLYSKQWNNAIQTYNFARPFITSKQPLINSGGTVYASWLFSTNKIKKGICLSYTYYSSSATNANILNKLNLHLFKPGIFIRTQYNNSLTADIMLSLLTGALTKSVNGTRYSYQDQGNAALAIGGCISAKVFYKCIKLKKQYALSPYLEASYSPYTYSPNFESLLNQTKQFTSKSYTSILSINCGIALSIQSK